MSRLRVCDYEDLLALFGGTSSSASSIPRDYPLRIGGTVLKVGAKTHGAFAYGSMWRLYYVRLPQLVGSQPIVLSAEVMTDV